MQLLSTRGAFIVCQLCISLDAERIYRTFAEVLQKEEVPQALRTGPTTCCPTAPWSTSVLPRLLHLHLLHARRAAGRPPLPLPMPGPRVCVGHGALAEPHSHDHPGAGVPAATAQGPAQQSAGSHTVCDALPRVVPQLHRHVHALPARAGVPTRVPPGAGLVRVRQRGLRPGRGRR